MNVPEGLRYSSDHEWVAVEGEVARIGITDYAQDALGDVVYVDLPSAGSAVVAAESFGEVESTKSVSDLYAPVSGTIVERNETLESQPELVNSDPYGEGWMVVIEADSDDPGEDMLSAREYDALIETS